MLNLSPGINIAKRQSGKTTSLIHLLDEDMGALLITYNFFTAKYLREEFPKLKDRIFAIHQLTDELTNANNTTKILYDECFEYFDKIKLGPRDIAVGTLPYPVTIHSTSERVL